MNRKNKILYLIHYPPPTHGVSLVSQLVYESGEINRGFKKRRIKLNLSNEIKELRRCGIVKFARFSELILKIIVELIFHRPSLVYFTIMPVGIGFWKDALLALIIKVFRVNILYHIHNRGIPHYQKKAFYRAAYRIVFKNTGIIHLSEGLANSELKPYFSEIAKIHVCPNAVPDNMKHSGEKNSSVPGILFFSNLFIHKGLKTLLKAVEILLKSDVEFKITIAGTPTDKSEELLKEFSDNFANQNCIEHFQGSFGEKKAEIFNSAQIFVFPSEFKEECMPLVILEALSVGLPVIASNIGAISSTVRHGENGYLIPKKAPLILANKIVEILEKKEMRISMGKASRKIYEAQFTVSHLEKTLRGIFLEYIKPGE